MLLLFNNKYLLKMGKIFFHSRMLCLSVPLSLLLGLLAVLLAGCTTASRLAHLYGNTALPALLHRYEDGGQSLYYGFHTPMQSPDQEDQTATQVFLVGGSGCISWKTVLPEYLDGFTLPAAVWALNKREVPDHSVGVLACGLPFDKLNRPAQWVADQRAFIRARIDEAPPKRAQNIVVIGVSEGAWVAAKLATDASLGITHLVTIGAGGWSLRHNLEELDRQGQGIDLRLGWAQVQRSPQSLVARWYGHPHQWWSDVLDLDPLENLLHLEIPIWAAMGADDASVPVSSLHALKGTFQAHGKTNLTTKVYSEADHRLQSISGNNRPAFFSDFSNWLMERQVYRQSTAVDSKNVSNTRLGMGAQ